MNLEQRIYTQNCCAYVEHQAGSKFSVVDEFTCSSDLQVDIGEKWIQFQRTDLKRVKEQVVEETDGSQQRAFLGRLVDDKSEEDGVNSQQRDEGQGGLC